MAGITSNLLNAGDAAHYRIDISTPEGQKSGLNSNSLVSCINLAAIPSRNIDRKIGELAEETMTKIDECLKTALGLR